MQCELCGSEQDNLSEIKLEGTKLKACDSCKTMGTSVTQQKTDKTSKKVKSSSSQTKPQNKLKDTTKLKPDYGKVIRNAREDENLSISSLSDKLNEKESRIRKIENQELKPTKKIAKKLQKKLSIEIYENPDVVPNTTQETDQRKATIGDLTD